MLFMQGLIKCDLICRVSGFPSSSPIIYIYAVKNKLENVSFVTEISTVVRQLYTENPFWQPDTAISL